ncbi:hypothetical protein QYM36_019633 [Artemia franciscana]|uniref:Homeobox domain-containing protein n=2 Tax=Artemia franciscana TaxID=6661 RepID=A0AA88KT67_ARTSF|nr:hypothetical protein QYM36_019633 [Artemia franciscana]
MDYRIKDSNLYSWEDRRRRCHVDYVPGMSHKRAQKRCRTKFTTRQTGELEHTFEETLYGDICTGEGLALKNNNTKNINRNSMRMREASVVLKRLSAEEIDILMNKKSKYPDTNLKSPRGRRSEEGTDGESTEGIFLKRKQRRRIPLTAYQTNKLESTFKPDQDPDIFTREGLSQRIKLTKARKQLILQYVVL